MAPIVPSLASHTIPWCPMPSHAMPHCPSHTFQGDIRESTVVQGFKPPYSWAGEQTQTHSYFPLWLVLSAEILWQKCWLDKMAYFFSRLLNDFCYILLHAQVKQHLVALLSLAPHGPAVLLPQLGQTLSREAQLQLVPAWRLINSTNC